MKSKRDFPIIGAICGSLIGVAAAIGWHDAHAATYQFHQGGFAEGAQVKGFFEGSDLDSDGWLLGYEITSFSLSFTGNSDIGAFTHSFANGTGFGNWAYKLGSGNLDDLHYGGPWTIGGYGENELGSVRYAMAAWEAEGTPFKAGVFDLDSGASSVTYEGMSVVAVPEPQTYALMLTGLAALGFVARRRRPAP